MSFVGGGFGAGSGPSTALRFAQTRGRIHGSPVQGVNYPSPFFDVAHTYLPVTVKQLFRWCRYYFLTNPLINAVVFKMSEYPITDVIIEHEDDAVKELWEDFLQRHLRYRPFQVECGLDFHTYGNCMVSLSYPFRKYITCQNCGFSEQARRIRNRWTFTNFNFRLNCPECGETGDATARDFYYKNASGIKLIRWNCEDVEITYNDVTGESTYFYTIPPTVKNDIVIGKKDVVEDTPQVFIQALRQQKGVVFSRDNFFHFKRPTLAHQDRGWGTPLILPVLKDTFYLQLMKKAQEAILIEHIVPLRILFPQAGSGSSDPYTTINLQSWRDHVSAEIARWRHDNNYIPIMPLPIGNQTIGGDGRALLLTQEIQVWSEQIINGMQVPLEFIKGGLSYSGTNVSMRMLENQFISYTQRHLEMLRWIIQETSSFMGWPKPDVRFKPFKMADDIQRKAYLFQLNQAQKISDTTLLADVDLDQKVEDEIMLKETDKRLQSTKKQQLAMAEVQAEAQVVMAKAQAKAQQVMMEAQAAPPAPGEPGAGMGAAGGGVPPGVSASPLGAEQNLGAVESNESAGETPVGVDIHQMAQTYAQQLVEMPPGDQQQYLEMIMQQSPELAALVQQYMSQMGGAAGGGQAQGPQVDMRPMPDKLPPRRDAPPV